MCSWTLQKDYTRIENVVASASVKSLTIIITDLYEDEAPPVWAPPAEVRQEFESISDLGIKDVLADGNVVRRIQLFECRKLR